MKNLKHPNIIPLIGISMAGQEPILVMPFMVNPLVGIVDKDW
jgi:hypothetical protein